MRRVLSAAFALGILTACGGRITGPSSSTSPSPARTSVASTPPTTTTTTPPSPTASPTPQAQVELPAGAPRKFGEPVEPDKIPLADIAPPHSQLTDSWLGPSPTGAAGQVVFTWSRGSDPFSAEHGLEVWQRFVDQPAWRVVYAFTDASDSGVLGVRFENGDLTGDGAEDLLTFEDTGGSGACGLWRVVESGAGFAAEIYNRQACDTQIEMGAGDLQVTEAVYLPGDAHCCPSKTRHTTLAWDGTAWQVTGRSVTPND